MQEAGAHRGLGLVQHGDQAAGAVSVAQGFEQFEVAAGDLIQLHEVFQGVVAEPGDVAERHLVEALHIGQGRSRGCSAEAFVVGAEGLQGVHAKVFFEHSGGFRGPELPVVENGERGLIFQLEAFDHVLAGHAVHDDLGGFEAQQFVGEFKAPELRETEIPGGEVQAGQAGAVGGFLVVDGTEKVVGGAFDQGVVQNRARGDDLDHLAFDQPDRLFGVFGLLADHHFQPGLDQFVQIVFQRVIGKPGQGNGVFAVFIPRGEGDVQGFGGGVGVVEKGLVEIAHAKEDQLVRMFVLDLLKLLEHGGQFGFRAGFGGAHGGVRTG